MNNNDARLYSMRLLMLGLDVSKLGKAGQTHLKMMLDELVKKLDRHEKIVQRNIK